MANPTNLALSNKTASPILLLRMGLLVPASSQVDISGIDYFELLSDAQLRDEINNDTLLLVVDAVEVTKEESLKIIAAPINLVPINFFSPSSSDPVTGSDGDMYYNTTLKEYVTYDAGLDKWLSMNTTILAYGQGEPVEILGFSVLNLTSQTSAGSYYRGMNAAESSNIFGFTALSNGTVVGLSYTRSDTDEAIFEVTADGVTIASHSSTNTSGADITLNADFSSGQILALRNGSGGNTTSDVQAWVQLRWRA